MSINLLTSKLARFHSSQASTRDARKTQCLDMFNTCNVYESCLSQMVEMTYYERFVSEGHDCRQRLEPYAYPSFLLLQFTWIGVSLRLVSSARKASNLLVLQHTLVCMNGKLVWIENNKFKCIISCWSTQPGCGVLHIMGLGPIWQASAPEKLQMAGWINDKCCRHNQQTWRSETSKV